MKKKRQNIIDDLERDVDKAIRLQEKVDSGLSTSSDTAVSVPIVRLSGLVPEIIDVLNQQKKAAKKDRADALTLIIYEIVGKKPNINISQLLERLEYHDKQSVIEEITEDDIEWIDKRGTHKFTPISAIKARLYRAKKKLNKRKK